MPISGRDWLRESVQRIRDDGGWGAINSLYDVYLGTALTVTSRIPLGTNVFSREWDAMIVLDACRVDALRAVAPEYEFLEEVNSIRSVGSHSFEWMSKTFVEKYRESIERTSYVTANPFAARSYFDREVPPEDRTIPFGPTDYGTVSRDTLGYIDEVQTYGIDDELGFILPETVTDRAIRAGREEETDRLLVHYMQPHDPLICQDGTKTNVYHRLRAGTVTEEEVCEWYLETLRTVLEEVAVLLENLDADRVVITADHGEAFGELGFYGHMPGFPHPAVRRVPWAETTAIDTGSYEPTIEPRSEEADVKQHLKELGYR